MKAKVNKVTIEIIQGNLLDLPVSSVVNATDTNLNLSDALVEKAGSDVQRICREIGWCDVGSAVITSAGKSPFEKLIHTVGPRWGEGSERGKLANATLRSLKIAEENQLKSIAMPPISVGTFGYPLENCAVVMLNEIVDFTFENLKYLRKVMICLDSARALKVFTDEFDRIIHELKSSGEGKVRAG